MVTRVGQSSREPQANRGWVAWMRMGNLRRKTTPSLPAQGLPPESQQGGKNREQEGSGSGRPRKNQASLGADVLATEHPPQKNRGSLAAHPARIARSAIDPVPERDSN